MVFFAIHGSARLLKISLMLAWYMNAIWLGLMEVIHIVVYLFQIPHSLDGETGHKNYRSKGSLVLKNYERQDATLLRLRCWGVHYSSSSCQTSEGGRLVISSDGVWDALSTESALECSHRLALKSAAAQIESTLECSRGLALENCQITETKKMSNL
ncbi:unnamed protein product [Lactuca saligna]|uniref:Uncharacterized protein n=1 Tax=Lactuca saligna TaxID=75948 RepID=A0AA36E059_LACSI|nr:unnamed protein product [Lactuca saligna]